MEYFIVPLAVLIVPVAIYFLFKAYAYRPDDSDPNLLDKE